jgi:Ca-activated chloride channel family protein
MFPQWLDKHTEIKQTGYDLMLAVDLSGSMRNRDFIAPTGARINRLEATKIVLSPFIARRQGDRVGLILFADQAYLQAPLTLDTEAVRSLLAKAVLGMAGRETAIGDAIGLAVKKLRERPNDSRALILLTDGNNTAGVLAPEQAAELAKHYQIRIYTIGVGSVMSGQQGLNEAPLRQISELTGGTYFPATDLQALANVYQHINDNLLQTEAESRVYLQRTPLYHVPLGLGLLALLGVIWLRLKGS